MGLIKRTFLALVFLLAVPASGQLGLPRVVDQASLGACNSSTSTRMVFIYDSTDGTCNTSGGSQWVLCVCSDADGDSTFVWAPPATPDTTCLDAGVDCLFAASATEGGAASSGDSATAFFSAGTLEHERGGLEADVSAYAGLVRIDSGSTSNVTNLAGLNTALGSSIADGAHTTDTDTTCLDAGVNCLFAGSASEGGSATSAAKLDDGDYGDVSSSSGVLTVEAGTATTAGTLAADPSDCPAGQWAAGIAADGTASGCTVDDTGTDDQIATEVPYTPTTGADWTDPDPAEVGGALDTLAAALGTLDTSADDLSDNVLGDLGNVSETGAGSGIPLVGDGAGNWAPGAVSKIGAGGADIVVATNDGTSASVAVEGLATQTASVATWDAAGDGSVDVEIAANGTLKIWNTASASNPIEIFGAAGGAGIIKWGNYSAGFNFASGGSFWYGNSFMGSSSSGPEISSSGRFIPRRDDSNTYLTGDASDTLSLVAGGQQGLLVKPAGPIPRTYTALPAASSVTAGTVVYDDSGAWCGSDGSTWSQLGGSGTCS